MKILSHPALTALGVAHLCLLTLTGPLVSPAHREVYHLSGSASSIFAPVLILFCAAWIVLTLLLSFARKPGWLQTTVWICLVVLLPCVIVKDWLSLAGIAQPHWQRAVWLCVPLPVCITALFVGRHSFALLLERVRSFATVLLGFVSLSALLVIGQLVLYAWQARALNAPLALHQRLQTASVARRSRIVWILFDELSYQQVYERRFPGLQLPAFDQLADESVVFTRAVPAGIATEVAVPSLMTGLPADRIGVTADGRHLSLHNPANGNWTAFDARRSVFQDAIDTGYSTGIAGSANPYCRILPEVLDHCFWTNHFAVAGDMVPGQTIAWNTFQFARHNLQPLLSHLGAGHLLPGDLVYDGQFHQLDYRELYGAADSLLNDSSANFLFLHMPVPHPGGIYNRRSSAFVTNGGSYIDNLALADQYLAHVRRLLEQRGEWDSSAIIVMGDHSWRTRLLWSGSRYWTPEDEAASQGQFDDRPAYIVKLPGQRQHAAVDASFEALRTRELLRGLLRDQWSSPEDLTAWALHQR